MDVRSISMRNLLSFKNYFSRFCFLHRLVRVMTYTRFFPFFLYVLFIRAFSWESRFQRERVFCRLIGKESMLTNCNRDVIRGRVISGTFILFPMDRVRIYGRQERSVFLSTNRGRARPSTLQSVMMSYIVITAPRDLIEGSGFVSVFKERGGNAIRPSSSILTRWRRPRGVQRVNRIWVTQLLFL